MICTEQQIIRTEWDTLRREEPKRPGLDRRALLRGAMALAPLAAGRELWTPDQAAAAPARSLSPGLVIRQKQPENLEYPFETLESFITPNDQFYVRSHFAVPQIDMGGWKLRVEGAVERPLELTYEELRRMPRRTLPVTLECAGNSRVFLAPAVAGAQWELGAVSTAEWTGVPLAAILERAGVRGNAVDVVFEGADSGELAQPPRPTGPIHFARSLPLNKARSGDVLLAYRMNDADLPVSHGFPLRAVVPGWYGMASVKWLTRIIVTDYPFMGHFQTVDYARWERRDGLPTRVPLTAIEVKSEISRPSMREVVAAGSNYRITGAAWAGENDVERVEVSTDGGKTWTAARLQGRPVRYAWRLWELPWRAPSQPGTVTLMSRATDSRGRTQAMTREPDRENYLISHVLPIDVNIR